MASNGAGPVSSSLRSEVEERRSPAEGPEPWVAWTWEAVYIPWTAMGSSLGDF